MDVDRGPLVRPPLVLPERQGAGSKESRADGVEEGAEEMGNAAWAATGRGLAGNVADGFRSEGAEGAG